MRFARKVAAVGGVCALLVLAGPAGAKGGGGGQGGVCYTDAPRLDAGWVSVIDNCFGPDRTEIAAGQTVRWQMDGNMPHTVTFGDSPVGSGQLGRGMTYAVQFNSPGGYPYSCLVHPGMNGFVNVEGAEVEGPPLQEIVDDNALGSVALAAASAPQAKATAANPLTVSIDAGTGFTLILFGLAIGAGAIGASLAHQRLQARRKT